ncbi:uncharacterized protein [Physcomitrium patens]|uniref:uncharacterized protein isoform X5 n=1 Tax=Physcomitrium patens TaxID=3218 RepID=UPI003CCCEF00
MWKINIESKTGAWVGYSLTVPNKGFKDITVSFSSDISKRITSWVPDIFSKSWPQGKFVIPPSNYLVIRWLLKCILGGFAVAP